MVAYHESGHALVGWLLKYTDALLRVNYAVFSFRMHVLLCVGLIRMQCPDGDTGVTIKKNPAQIRFICCCCCGIF